MAIVFDASSSGGFTGGTGLTVAHTIGSGSNKILIVGTTVQDSNHSNYPVTGITYAGIPLTKVRSDEATGNNRTEIWYILNPNSGTNNIVVTTTGALDKSLVAASFTGVAQSGIPDAQAGQTGNGVASALQLTTVSNNCFTFHIMSTEASITGVSNGTEIGPVTGQSFENTAGDYRGPLTPPGNFSTGFTMGSGQSYAQSAISFAPASATAAFTVPPSQNFISTTLNGAITPTATTITLTSTANLLPIGYLEIDRIDANGNQTPNNRETISYTGVSGNTITGVTRGVDNSLTNSHANLAVVETIPEVGYWNSLTTIVSSAFDTQGLLKSITSPVSLALPFINTLYTSVASLAIANIGNRLDVSSASVTGFGYSPIFTGYGFYTGPTIALGGLYVAPRSGTLGWVSVITRYVASTASVGFDFKVRGASVFANATTQPAIAAGGTYVSTASIATVNINRGDVIQGDVASVGASGAIQLVNIQGGIN